MKVCTKCKLEKPFSEFHKDKKNKDGYRFICKECVKIYKNDNADKIKETEAIYRYNNSDKISKKNENWRKENKDHVKEYGQNWRKDNPDYFINYYQDNLEKERERSRKNHQNNLEYYNDKSRKHRALKAKATIGEISSRYEIYKRDSGICGICEELVQYEDYHLDHIIPLSKGGAHADFNLQVTHSWCNLSKGNKIIN